MNKKLKLALVLFLVPCFLLFGACSISNIEKELGLTTNPIPNEELTTLIKGENGANGKDGINGTNGINGKDGKDGDQIDLYAIYEKIKAEEGYSGNFSDFVKEYLGTQDTVYATSKALRSTVCIYAGGESKVTYMDMQGGYHQFTQKTFGAGSGVIYSLDKSSGDALIITNYHVVYDKYVAGNICTDINILLYGNEQFSISTKEYVIDYRNYNQYYYQEFNSNYSIKASYVGGSMEYDIAVLKISSSDILKNSEAISAQIASSNDISAGEKVIAVGNPNGSGLAATTGCVSKDSEYITMTGVDGITECRFRVIRTDSAINGGNSGGGLYNTDGELVGIVNAKITSSSIDNIGYAIPSIVAVNAANNIIRNCNGEDQLSIKRCMLGIGVIATTSSAEYNEATLKTTIVEKVKVESISNTSICKNILNVGDIITKITINKLVGGTETKEITRSFHIVDISLNLQIGDTIIIERTNAANEILPHAVIEIPASCVKICK